MKNISLIFGVCALILLLFGSVWSNFGFYDTDDANKWILPYWAACVGTMALAIWTIKKFTK